MHRDIYLLSRKKNLLWLSNRLLTTEEKRTPTGLTPGGLFLFVYRVSIMLLQISLMALIKIFHAHLIRLVIEPVPDDRDEIPNRLIRIFDGGDNVIYYNMRLQAVVGCKLGGTWIGLIEKEVSNAYSTGATANTPSRDQPSNALAVTAGAA